MEILIVWLACAILTAIIANAKGLSVPMWAAIGFVTGLIGVIIVMFVPSERA